MVNKLSDGTIRDEENDDLRAGCKLGRGDAVWSVGVDGGNNCLGGLVWEVCRLMSGCPMFFVE